MKSIKIVFVILGTVGTFGHFRRVFTIIEELKKLKNKKFTIVIISDQPLIFLKKYLKDNNIKLIIINKGFPHPNNGGRLKQNYQNELSPILIKEKPFLIVFDTFFPNDIEKINMSLEKTCRKIFISRLFNQESWNIFLEKKYNKLFDKVIIVEKNGQKNLDNIYFFSNLIRDLDKDKISLIKRKYQIKKDNLVILFSCGGGGFQEGEKMINIFTLVAKKLIKNFLKIKPIIITGPFYKGTKLNLKDKKIIINQFEEDMLELMFCSDLIISEAGYNSVKEICFLNKPSIFIPVTRPGENQLDRIKKETSDNRSILIDWQDKTSWDKVLKYFLKNNKLLSTKNKSCQMKDNKEIIKEIISL